MTDAREPSDEVWMPLRLSTQARIGLGRAGDSLPSRRVLEFQTAHATARDAVHEPLDVGHLEARISALGVPQALVVTSQASSRSEYLRRPDLGRRPADVGHLPATGADIAIVLADGLSPRALTDHGPGLFKALVDTLATDFTVGPPVIATQARVALGDHIGPALGAQTVIVVIGERPGLSVANSLGIYLTHRPREGCTDADRNCVSNIHPPDGLGYEAAAAVAAELVAGAHRLGRSGVALKDTSRERVTDGRARTIDP
ncbi:ethanolamine ammonia-lyase subunit EutC [Gordonia sp. CPCC 206044]|uniref:ethanolamine ammonia-lyase subunit EutC n=1 Tax=Gordonia sp. CPCC 206044 TaxID=3140793 RepID=UPI003AF38C03